MIRVMRLRYIGLWRGPCYHGI